MARLAVAVTLLALAAPASALADAPGGAPGECTGCVVPPAAPATPAERPADMARRFGIGARVVSMSLAPKGGAQTDFGGGGLAASYRINRRWEAALALDTLDAPEGPDLHVVQLSARFHMRPHRPWDWYLLGGIGVVHDAPAEGGADQGGGRGQLHVGVGLQRRFRWIGLSAELHMVSVGPRDDAQMAPAAEPAAMIDEPRTGGELTLGATVYF
jgi:hypothetical protein